MGRQVLLLLLLLVLLAKMSAAGTATTGIALVMTVSVVVPRRLLCQGCEAGLSRSVKPQKKRRKKTRKRRVSSATDPSLMRLSQTSRAERCNGVVVTVGGGEQAQRQ